MGDNTEVLSKLDEILSKLDGSIITDWLYVDATITAFGTYNLSSYIPGDHKIKGVGMISRQYSGWFGFTLSFTDTSFKFDPSGEGGGPYNVVIRVWYV